ncbi:flavin reductase family protein (plasmid) [Paracoccus methylovorus]|uniref:Flavin reductase family protein n=1 Tax=Paracoccus methylovorus TaxID=2812658 RepID=A0ABX7JJ93_9RHOB|nr:MULTISPECIES: flavin reductase family protein [Paracoccus]QRZ14306.1 flavin reductase family protein [Paracoccus methylovorus]
MQELPLGRAFTLIEPGPVTLITTNDGRRDNVMTITWTMVMDFTPRFAIATGHWNHSWTALSASGECVIAIPTMDMIDTVIGIGTCSGAEVDKFERFGLSRCPGTHVRAPLLRDCLANVECRVVDIIEPHGIVVLDGLAAWFDGDRSEKRTLHAVGDGSFVVDGDRLDRRDAMRSKLPEGI